MIDWKKPIETLGGKPVEIVSTNSRRPYFPIMGYVGDSDILSYWKADGRLFQASHPSILDLRNVPVEHEGWINVYSRVPTGCSFVYLGLHSTKDKADEEAHDTRIACIPIKFKEGEGL